MSKSPSDTPSLVNVITRSINSREFGIFIYYATIIAIGFTLVNIYVDGVFVNYQGWLVMFAYLFVVMLLEPPKSASFDAEPFEETDIVDF